MPAAHAEMPTQRHGWNLAVLTHLLPAGSRVLAPDQLGTLSSMRIVHMTDPLTGLFPKQTFPGG